MSLIILLVEPTVQLLLYSNVRNSTLTKTVLKRVFSNPDKFLNSFLVILPLNFKNLSLKDGILMSFLKHSRIGVSLVSKFSFNFKLTISFLIIERNF